MKVAIDGKWMKGPLRGMGRFAWSLLKNAKFEIEILSPSENIIGRILRNHLFWEQIVLPLRSRINDIDVLICPYNTAPLVTFGKTKIVLVVHDLIFLDDNISGEKSFSAYQTLGAIYRRYVVKRAARKAHHIITVSNSSRTSLVTHFNLCFEKISVIPNHIPDAWFKNITDGKRENFIFTVSGSAKSKNLRRLLEAHSMVLAWCNRDGLAPPKLVVSGLKSSLVPFFLELTRLYCIEDHVTFTDYIGDLDLQRYYEKCNLFVSNSLDEGFGIPVIEALTKGTRICCSKIPVYEETLGEKAVFFDPYDVSETASVIYASLIKCNVRDHDTADKHSFTELEFYKIRDKIFDTVILHSE